MQEIEMNWYTKRKILYSSILIILIIGWFVFLLRGFIWAPATCFDGKKNNIETGIDCGGSCLLQCSTDYKPLSISAARAIKTADKKYDILVLVDNPNTSSAPMMLSLVVELYDNNGKNFKTMRATVPGSTGYQIPIYNKSIVADNITNVIARLEPYEMYKTRGSYDLKLKNFTYNKKDSSTDINVFYSSPYSDDVSDNFVTMLVAYNSLGNAVGFYDFTVKGLKHDKLEEVFVSLPYRVEGDIASVKFIPLTLLYEK